MKAFPLQHPSKSGPFGPALKFLAALSSPMLALLLSASPAFGAPPIYSVQVLTPGAGHAINRRGDAAGQAADQSVPGGPEHAFLYRGGQLTDLGALAAASGYSEANAINGAGHVAGYFAGDVQGKGFLYGEGGQVQTFAVPGSQYTQALGLNDLEQVVGAYFSSATGHTRAFLRQPNGEFVDLGTLGGTDAQARAINHQGRIVGWFLMADGRHAFLLPPGATAPKDLGSLGPGAEANAINELKQVVGTSAGHAFLYAKGTLSDLGAFGGQQTVAYGINNLSQIVGRYVVGAGEAQSGHGWVYLEGQMYDLNGLLDPAAQGWTITDARGINDQGQIIATATNVSHGNGSYAVILTPEQSLFSNADVPAGSKADNSVELGVQFASKVAGKLTAIRWYKPAIDAATSHTVHVWSLAGGSLGSATSSNETASGWQTVQLPTPVAINSGITYVASYHTNALAYTGGYFTQGKVSGVLTAHASTRNGFNGVYSYASVPVVPTSTWNASNYWVDVVFVAD